MKRIKEYGGTLLMFLSGGFLPFSIYLLTLPTLIVFALSSILHFKLLKISSLFKTILFIASITAVPYFAEQIQFNNGIKGREIYILPNDYSGLFGVIFEHPLGQNKQYFTTNRKYEIPSNGILLSKFDSPSENAYLKYSGNRLFATKDQFRRSNEQLLFDVKINDTLKLSQILCNENTDIVEFIAYKNIRFDDNTEYLGYFYQVKKPTEKSIRKKDVNAELIKNMLQE